MAARSLQLTVLLSTPIGKIPAQNSSPLLFTFFGLLVLANALLSYGDFSFPVKILIVFIGLFAPLAFYYGLLKARKTAPNQESFVPSLPFWVILLTAAIFLRLDRLTTLSHWPIMDEGMYGYFASRLYERWNWELLHWVSQEPILYTWGLAFCFKLFGPSLFSLWFFPAVCSLLCLPLAWMAFQQKVHPSNQFLYFAFFAVGFWPLYLGRFSVQSILLVLWELLVFGLLSGYLSEPRSKARFLRAGALGVAVGIGFYIYLAWPLVALFVGFILLTDPSVQLPQRLKAAGLYGLAAGILTLPLFFAYSHEYRGYFAHLGSSTWSDGLNHLPLTAAYFKDLFWGNPGGFFRYGPLWGGLFNPLITSFVFWGIAQLACIRFRPLALWFVAGAILFFLPAFLTNDLELMRLTPLLPVLLAVAVLGTQSLLLSLPFGARPLFLAVALAASTGLDAYHLFGVYARHWEKNIDYYGSHKSPEFCRAYSLLKPLGEKDGPGLILLNFNPDPYDQTLFIASYGFNAAENPQLDPSNVKWAAVLANTHEEPFFKKFFPEGKWAWLSEGLNKPDGGFILEIIPMAQNNRNLLTHWAQADLSLKELNRMVMERDVDPNQGPMLGVLEKAYPFFKGDPFLESRYWRIMAFHHAAEGKIAEAVESYQEAIKRGLPMAHLYNEMGCLLFKEKALAKAKRAFQETLSLELNLTNAKTNLDNLLLLKSRTK